MNGSVLIGEAGEAALPLEQEASGERRQEGCEAHPDILEPADKVSGVREIKHAYRKRVEPQPGTDC